MGLGAFPASDARFLGMLGMHGTLEANLAMHQADLVICVGARFDDRVTGKLDDFCPHARKIHLDIDPGSINKVVRVDVPSSATARPVLDALLALPHCRSPRRRTPGALVGAHRALARRALLRLRAATPMSSCRSS